MADPTFTSAQQLFEYIQTDVSKSLYAAYKPSGETPVAYRRIHLAHWRQLQEDAERILQTREKSK